MRDTSYPDWDAVYRGNVTWVYRLMYAKDGNRPDVEDLTAEVFTTALQPLRVSATVPEVRAYLKRTARTVLASYWRHRMGREVTVIDDDVPQAASDGAVDAEAPGRVRELLATLPDNYRRILELRFLQAFSIREAAAQMGVSVANAKVLQYRAPSHGGTKRCGGPVVSDRTVRHFVEGLLRGRRTRRARPDDVQAAQMAAAIELRAARTGSDSPSEQFIADLHRRLSEEIDHDDPPGTRRRVIVGTGLAAASAAAGIAVGRNLLAPKTTTPQAGTVDQGTLAPNTGTWRAVGAGTDLPTGGALAFDLGSMSGFVHRGPTRLQAVSGVCTHQGCKLWLDAEANRLRCPCHSTSFSLEGQTLTHQLPTAPPPLPRIEVRENNGTIEVFTPSESA